MYANLSLCFDLSNDMYCLKIRKDKAFQNVYGRQMKKINNECPTSVIKSIIKKKTGKNHQISLIYSSTTIQICSELFQVLEGDNVYPRSLTVTLLVTE